MALRVLLADESSTIKKVIQLSLQDFNVEVKSVTVGLDVLSVAKTYRPDVVLADVLLAKRSGYEVCHDLKNDPETADIPVVLMWSGFMEIDEQKARLCGTDRRLEKPFDAAALRYIVQELVPRTQNNPASPFLQFPPLPPFEEPKRSAPVSPVSEINFIPPKASITPDPLSLKPQSPPVQHKTSAPDEALMIDDTNEGDDEWVQQPISPKNSPQAPSAAPTFPLQTQNTKAPKTKEDDFTEFPLSQAPSPSRPQANQQAAAPGNSQTRAVPQISEDLVREEIQKWLSQHMPEIAERLIRDEINRLLQETEKTIQGP